MMVEVVAMEVEWYCRADGFIGGIDFRLGVVLVWQVGGFCGRWY